MEQFPASLSRSPQFWQHKYSGHKVSARTNFCRVILRITYLTILKACPFSSFDKCTRYTKMTSFMRGQLFRPFLRSWCMPCAADVPQQHVRITNIPWLLRSILPLTMRLLSKQPCHAWLGPQLITLRCQCVCEL